MTPYYRIYATPVAPEPSLIDCDDKFYRDLLANPPDTREAGWTLWSAREVRRTIEGLEALGYDNRRILLLTNGHIEFWMPCLEETFQWGQAESEKKLHPWLYDYAVCELPVNFMMLAKAIYDHANLAQDIIASEAYYGIKDFILMPFGPRTLANLRPMEYGVRPYQSDDLNIEPVQVSKDFIPDCVAYEMVKQVYNAFGYNSQDIRLFNDDHMFTER